MLSQQSSRLVPALRGAVLVLSGVALVCMLRHRLRSILVPPNVSPHRQQKTPRPTCVLRRLFETEGSLHQRRHRQRIQAVSPFLIPKKWSQRTIGRGFWF